MLNLGLSFVVLVGSFAILPPICWIAYKLSNRFSYCDRVYKQLRARLQYNYYLRLILEVYLDLTINTIVNLYNIKASWQKDSHSGDKLSAIIALIFIIAIISFTRWTLYILHKQKGQLDSSSFKSKFGELIADLKSDEKYGTFFFLLRRLVVAVIIVNLQGYGYFQIMFLAYQQTAQIIYIGLMRPYEARLNEQHLVNEYLVMVCIYHLFWFTDWVTTISPTA